MRFRDEGIVVGAKRMGEHQYILYLFTKNHGLRGGVLGGIKSLGLQAALCTGSVLEVRWQARLEAQLGRWTVDDIKSVPQISSEQGARCMLIGGLLMKVLVQGEKEEWLYEDTRELIQFSSENALLFWACYNLWERKLLAASGFGLDCRACAVTGKTENLRYISPRSGKAVSEEGAGIYKPRLLPLPSFWYNGDNLPISTVKLMEDTRISEVVAGLKTTEYFLRRENFLDSMLSTLRSSMIKMWITGGVMREKCGQSKDNCEENVG